MAKLNKIVRASLILMVGTVLSKVLGFVRELVVAYRFGAGSISDAFVLTNSIPTLIFVSISTAVNINFIPYYQRIKEKEERDSFTSNLANICVVILLIGCFIICAFPKLVLKIFATGLPKETEAYAIVMLRIVVFSIIPIILAYLFQAYLQANELFVSTALYGIVTNVTIIIFTFFASERYYYILSIGTIMSHVVGLIPIIYSVKCKTSFRYHACIRFSDKRIKELALLTLPLLIEDLASSMSLVVDRNLASFLDSGTISGLGYAGTIGNIASTMIATAIITATFPVFSKLIASGNIQLFKNIFNKYAVAIGYILGPIAVFLIVNSNDIVKLIFEHGEFNSAATVIVSESMMCYAVGVLPMGLQSFFIRGFYALQDTKTPVRIKVFALICNIILNLLSVKHFRHMGIALSTSISYLIAYFLLANRLKVKHNIDNLIEITRESFFSVVFSLISGTILYWLFNYVLCVDSILLKILFEGILFVGCYIIFLYIFRRNSVREIYSLFKSKNWNDM